MRAKFINESIFKPKDEEDIIKNLSNLSKEELNNKLLDAVIEGDITIVKLLLNIGADVNTKVNDVTKIINGWTPLIFASRYGFKDIVSLLIDKGVDINLKSIINNTTVLMHASIGGHLDIVKMLLDAGANINEKDKYGNTALTWSLSNGHNDVVELLKKHGAKE